MFRVRRQLSLFLGALLSASPAAAQTAVTPRSDTRLELARFGEQLDGAIAKVSQPSPLQVLGPMSASRGYLLPGYGAIFVLPARALPGDKRVIVMRGAPRAKGTVRIEVPLMPPMPDMPDFKDLERQIQAMEFQVEAFSRAAERESREADQALERFAQEVRVRFPEAQPGAIGVARPSTAPVAPVPAPVPEAAATAAPAAVAAPAAAPAAPPPPPWRFWFQSDDEEDARSPERVVDDVRVAVTQALETQGVLLRVVRPEECLAVVVDFTARTFPFRGERRAERTIVIRARKHDLDERQAGRLSGEELKKRIDYFEY